MRRLQPRTRQIVKRAMKKSPPLETPITTFKGNWFSVVAGDDASDDDHDDDDNEKNRKK